MTQTATLTKLEKQINTIQEFIGKLMERESSSVRQGDYCSIIEMLEQIKNDPLYINAPELLEMCQAMYFVTKHEEKLDKEWALEALTSTISKARGL